MTERKKLVKKLDDITSKIVRLRDKKCITCGSMERLGCGHLFSRQAYSTRWDLKNCHAQCWGCNFRHEYDFYRYEQMFKNKYGEEDYHELYRRFNNPHKFSDKELRELLEERNAQYKILQGL